MSEKIFYNTKDHIKLCGILTKVNESSNIVVMCHGLMGDKNNSDHFLELSESLTQNQINSFRFDFRAHGESEGIDYKMTPLRERIDLETTLQLLQKKGFQHITLLGASFGACVASSIDFKKYPSIEKLILWYGLLDFTNTLTDFFTEDSKQIAEKKGYKVIESTRLGISFKLGKDLYQEIENKTPYKNIINLDIPILFVHGTSDITIPYQSSKDVASKCKNATLKLIEGEYHAFRRSEIGRKEAMKYTIDFIKN